MRYYEARIGKDQMRTKVGPIGYGYYWWIFNSAWLEPTSAQDEDAEAAFLEALHTAAVVHR